MLCRSSPRVPAHSPSLCLFFFFHFCSPSASDTYSCPALHSAPCHAGYCPRGGGSPLYRAFQGGHSRSSSGLATSPHCIATGSGSRLRRLLALFGACLTIRFPLTGRKAPWRAGRQLSSAAGRWRRVTRSAPSCRARSARLFAAPRPLRAGGRWLRGASRPAAGHPPQAP